MYNPLTFDCLLTSTIDCVQRRLLIWQSHKMCVQLEINTSPTLI